MFVSLPDVILLNSRWLQPGFCSPTEMPQKDPQPGKKAGLLFMTEGVKFLNPDRKSKSPDRRSSKWLLGADPARLLEGTSYLPAQGAQLRLKSLFKGNPHVDRC